MRRAHVTLLGGLVLVVLGVGVVSLGHPDTVARANGLSPENVVAGVTSHARLCQARELVPRGTTSLAVWISSFSGPAISVELTAEGREIAHGRRGSGWTSRSVTIPLNRAVPRDTIATVCFTVTPKYEEVVARGNPRKGAPATTLNGKPLEGAITIEYLHSGSRSWLSRAPQIARHLGLGRVPSGAWAPAFAFVLVLAIAGTVAVAGRLE